uniref:uncharacterized protein LOC120343147 n=1 Tax=Styela clava TaxID=7725 RepID=UPI0019394652|nr:uncharacterized protein LOC120343147 [Styela clava]
MRLKRCEAHLLNLVVPFIRVAHIPRSREFRVIGSMICVEAEIQSSIETILPVDQNLIPIALKRRPEYRGNFIEEVVSKQNILAYFNFLKQNNPLFRDVHFDITKLDQFLSCTIDCIEDQDEWKTSQSCAVANADTELNIAMENIIDYSDGNNVIDCGKILGESDNTTVISENNDNDEDYDTPEYLTEFIADTVIDPLTKTESTCHVTDTLASAIIFKEQTSIPNNSNSHRNRMPFVTVAPTAGSKFTRWEECEYLEEKCFPHLFPNGTGVICLRIWKKEQIEIKRSCATFFRKSKIGKSRYTAQFFKNVDKQEIERTDLGYKVFKNVRGTAPYFQSAKLKIMTMIRQLGSPNLFLTLSSAESYWNDFIKMLLEKERNQIVSDEIVRSLDTCEINKILTRNVTQHFSNRMKVIFRHLQKPGLLGKYKVSDYFFRIEFQMRGAPHVHSLLWLQDENGKIPPRYDSEESRSACEAFIDFVIAGKLPQGNSDILDTVSTFQRHSHTFTCRKKSRKITIHSDEGHGVNDCTIERQRMHLNTCRFKFPHFPMPRTMILDAPNENVDPEDRKIWKSAYVMLRKFILRQTHSDRDTQCNQEFLTLTFNDFLHAVGLTEEAYYNALRASLAENKCGSQVFLKRDCCDLWTNNYNKNILEVHQANMDISFVLNEFACVAYVLGYITKNESGLSRLLHQIEVESAKFGRTPGEKLKLFSRALENSREVSRSEVVYRMLGLHFVCSTRTHEFVQTSHPSARDGIMKGNIADLDDDENPFQNSKTDYYVDRPDDLEDLCLAEWIRDYKIIYKSKSEKAAYQLIDADHEENYEETDTARCSRIRWLKNQKGDSEKILNIQWDEMKEIHEVSGRTIDEVFDMFKEQVEKMRKEFEPHRKMLVNIDQAMEDIETHQNGDPDDMLYEDQEIEDASTEIEEELQHFVNLANSPAVREETIFAKRIVVCEMIRKLNKSQRLIFDDVMERIDSQYYPIEDAIPFHLYIGGKAGTGKSFLMKSMIEASRLLLMRSGDNVTKPTVLVLSPTAAAARIIGGETIESGLKFSRNDDSEAFQVFSSNATSAYEYENVKVVFIDEISMVGSNKLHQIHTRLEQILGRKGMPFAGLPLIVTGDFSQLPPVKDTWIFANNRRPQRTDFTAPNKWKLHFKLYELTEKMRSIDDVEFSHLCDNVAMDTLNASDESMLFGRIKECPNENNNDHYREGKLAIIVTDNKNAKREKNKFQIAGGFRW